MWSEEHDCVDPHQVKLAMYWRVGLCLLLGGGGGWGGWFPEVTECAGGGCGGYWSEGMSLSASALGEGAWGGWETGAMPCAKVPETRLSTPPPAPGRPPAAATLIRPGGNLKHIWGKKKYDSCSSEMLTTDTCSALITGSYPLTCKWLH